MPRVGESMDLRLLLAQSTPAAAGDGKLRDDTILVAFAASAPDNAEEEVAKEHGLELVDRTDLPALGMRIARYRIRGDRPMAAAVASLQTDPRVQQAQGNYEYRPVPPSAPATEVSGLKDRPLAEAKPGAEAVASARRRSENKTAAIDRVARANVGEVGAAKPARLSKDNRANASAQSPPRLAKVADVLAGGL